MMNFFLPNNMQSSMKNRVLNLVLLGSLVLLFGCASNRNYNYEKSASSVMAGQLMEDSRDRVIIYNASLTIVSKKPDTTFAHIAEVAKKYNGYLLNISNYMATIRVTSKNLKSALSDIENLGRVKHKYLYSEDVTEEYRDNAIRLENAEKARGRYLELLQKAQNVDETIKVEKELERLNTDIDLLKGKQKRYEHLEEFSTITVSVEQKKYLGPLGYVSKGLYYIVKWMFVLN
jgi:hypothetical protein